MEVLDEIESENGTGGEHLELGDRLLLGMIDEYGKLANIIGSEPWFKESVEPFREDQIRHHRFCNSTFRVVPQLQYDARTEWERLDDASDAMNPLPLQRRSSISEGDGASPDDGKKASKIQAAVKELLEQAMELERRKNEQKLKRLETREDDLVVHYGGLCGSLFDTHGPLSHSSIV